MAHHPASVIIVPGSFATAPMYEPLVDAVKAQGLDAKLIDLPSANDGSVLPPPTADDDAAHIRRAVLSTLDDGSSPRDVVLALHSYSGVPGSSALKDLDRAARSAQGKATAVVGVVYTASFILPLGQSNRKFLSDEGVMPEPFKSGIRGGYLPPVDPAFISWVFNDIESEKEVKKWFSMMVRHSSDSYDGTVKYEPWKDIHSVTIIPEKDATVPTYLQEKMYEEATAAGGKITRVFVEGGGHMVTISRSELVAAEIGKLAKA